MVNQNKNILLEAGSWDESQFQGTNNKLKNVSSVSFLFFIESYHLKPIFRKVEKYP